MTLITIVQGSEGARLQALRPGSRVPLGRASNGLGLGPSNDRLTAFVYG